jgi:hypothetical protein
MKRSQLAHLIRAAASITTRDDLIVIGSQAILGTYSDTVLPDELTASIELDVAIADDELDGQAARDLIDGSIGEHSMFQVTYGVYAQGVSTTTATLPPGWEARLIPFPTEQGGAVAWCLEPHDLCASKLIAGRAKDVDYVAAAIRFRLVDPAELKERIEACEASPDARTAALGYVDRFAGDGLPETERQTWWRRRRDADRDHLSRLDASVSESRRPTR